MNKKLLVVSILAVFTLVAISFATTVSSNTVKTVEKKESPLFGIRTRRAIGERLQELRERIKARFIGERVFFLPFNWLRNAEERPVRERLADKTDTPGYDTCYQTCYTPIACIVSILVDCD